jgi:hypothetical protein
MKAGRDPKTVTDINGTTISKDTARLLGKIITWIIGRDNLSVIDGIPDGYRFLDRTSLSHIPKLVIAHWALFAQSIGRAPPLTQDDFIGKFNRVMEARNRAYHHRSIKDTRKVVRTTEELLDRLDFSLLFVYSKIAACSVTAPKFALSIEPRHKTY